MRSSLGVGGVDGATETAVARRVELGSLPKVGAREVGPQSVQKDHLGIRTLPEHEVTGALLPRAAHEQVDVGKLWGVQMPLNRLLCDSGCLHAPGCDVLSERAHGIRDLGAP